jgi:hypothetical protein
MSRLLHTFGFGPSLELIRNAGDAGARAAPVKETTRVAMKHLRFD